MTPLIACEPSTKVPLASTAEKPFTEMTLREKIEYLRAKKGTVIVAADVTSVAEFLTLCQNVGEDVFAIKTHMDMLNDYDATLPGQLRKIADKKEFIIIADEKYRDIGAVSEAQFKGGIFRTADWADMVTVHTVSGPDILQCFKTDNGREVGLLLVAQMSSKGNLLSEEYTRKTVEWAESNPQVVGLICQQRLSENGLLHLTPGVSIAEKSDDKGQQYNSPEAVIERGADGVIVGRGICKAKNPAQAAKTYRRIVTEALATRALALAK